MMLHKAVEQRFVSRSSDLLQFDGAQFGERAGDRRHVDEHRRGSFAPQEWVEGLEADRRQFDLARAIEHQ